MPRHSHRAVILPACSHLRPQERADLGKRYRLCRSCRDWLYKLNAETRLNGAVAGLFDQRPGLQHGTHPSHSSETGRWESEFSKSLPLYGRALDLRSSRFWFPFPEVRDPRPWVALLRIVFSFCCSVLFCVFWGSPPNKNANVLLLTFKEE